jgi:hypothetical protein
MTRSTLTPVAPESATEAPACNFLALSKLNWQNSDSSAVAHWAYSRDEARLWVVFRPNPAVAYAYEGVGSATVLDMLDAPSLGSFVARKVRNQYADTRVDLAVRDAQVA